jgi:hypothetical protein
MSRLYSFPFLTAEQVADSPSLRDGWTPEKEALYRKKAIKNIFDTARHKPFPNMSAGTASLATAYYLRFYTRRSLEKNSAFIVVCAALFLAGKANDEPRSLDALSVEILKRWYGRDNPNMRAKLTSKSFLKTLRDTVEAAELSLMMTMGFDLNFELPHPHITRLAAAVPGLKPWRGSSKAQQFMLSFCNDIFKSDPTMVLQYPARQIALAAFHFYFKQRREDPPPQAADGAPWFVAEGLSQEVWKDISHRLVTRVYTDRPKVKASGVASESGMVLGGSQGTAPAAAISTVNNGIAAGGGGGGGLGAMGATSSVCVAVAVGGGEKPNLKRAIATTERPAAVEPAGKRPRPATEWVDSLGEKMGAAGPMSMGPGIVREFRVETLQGGSAAQITATPPVAEDEDSELEEGEVRE